MNFKKQLLGIKIKSVYSGSIRNTVLILQLSRCIIMKVSFSCIGSTGLWTLQSGICWSISTCHVIGCFGKTVRVLVNSQFFTVYSKNESNFCVFILCYDIFHTFQQIFWTVYNVSFLYLKPEKQNELHNPKSTKKPDTQIIKNFSESGSNDVTANT